MSNTLDPRRFSLRFLLTAVIVGTLLICGGLLITVVQHVVQTRLHNEAVESLRHTAEIARNRLDREMYERFRDLEMMVLPLEHMGRDVAEQRSFIDSAHRSFPDYSWIAVVGTDGIVRQANQGLLEGQSMAERPWFAPSLKGPYVGDVHDAALLAQLIGPDADGQAPRFVDIAFPLRNNAGAVIAVLAAHLDWNWARSVMMAFEGYASQNHGHQVLILDKDNQVLSGPLGMRGQTLDVTVPTAGVQVGQQGDGWIVAAARTSGYRDFTGLGWTVVIRTQTADVFALAAETRGAILWVSLPIFLAFILVGWFLGRHAAAPITALTAAIEAHTPIPQMSAYREVIKLTTAFEGLLDRLKRRQAEVEAEVALRTGELHDLLRVVDAHSIVSMTDGNGNITYANDLFCRVTGYTREELIGQNHRLIKSNHHNAEFYRSMWKTILRGEVWQGLVCNHSKDGREYWVKSTIAPTLSAQSSPHRFISLRTDITEEMNIQAKFRSLSEVLEIYKQIVETTAEAVSVADASGRLIYTNPAHAQLLGVPSEAVEGQHFSTLIPEEGQQKVWKIAASAEAGHGWRGLLPMRRGDGTVFTSMSNVGVIPDDTGKTTFIYNIFSDYSPELRRRAEVEQARADAETANKAKSDFLSNMSHELRTPLNAISGFAQLLLMAKSNPLDERQRSQVEYILKGGDHLLNLINEILDLAKIEAGKMTLSLEPVSLRDVIDECLSLVTPYKDKYEVTISDQTGQSSLPVQADQTRAKQIILNLLTNAAKYNRRGGTIILTCETVDDNFRRLTVADTGEGIPLERQTELFKPFSRLGAETSDIEGTGIGLVLTKTVIEMMKGRIGFASVEGEGSRFWLDFPVAEGCIGSPAATEAAEATDIIHHEGGRRILLYVEDNPANISLMQDILAELPNWGLMIAETAEHGLDLAASHRPDLILMDINLPGIDGVEAMKRLAGNPHTRTIPVHALSADATKGTIQRGLAAGFVSYLTKPIRVGDLLAILNANRTDT